MAAGKRRIEEHNHTQEVLRVCRGAYFEIVIIKVNPKNNDEYLLWQIVATADRHEYEAVVLREGICGRTEKAALHDAEQNLLAICAHGINAIVVANGGRIL